MERHELSRRTLLKRSAVTLSGLTLLNSAWFAQAVPLQAGDEVLPWLDQPAENPVPQRVTNLLNWEALDAWVTPPDQFFSVSHYGQPEIDMDTWRLEITGLVEHPMTLTLDDLMTWPRQEVDFTVECSGNHGFDLAGKPIRLRLNLKDGDVFSYQFR